MEERKAIISHMSTDEKLDAIFDKVHSVDSRCLGIEHALSGNPVLRTKGLVQQVTEHEDKDFTQFNEISDRIESIEKSQNKQAAFVKGGMWVIGGIVTLIGIAISIIALVKD